MPTNTLKAACGSVTRLAHVPIVLRAVSDSEIATPVIEWVSVLMIYANFRIANSENESVQRDYLARPMPLESTAHGIHKILAGVDRCVPRSSGHHTRIVRVIHEGHISTG